MNNTLFSNKIINDNIIEDTLIIDHVIPIYFKSKESKRFFHTKKIFKYYNDLRKILLQEYNIKLNFTIIGSNKETSNTLFNEYLNNDLFNDCYIEFDQKKIESTVNSCNVVVDKEFYNMLNEKWKTGLRFSVFNKLSDIIVMRGSNDLVDPLVYLQMAKQFDKKNDKLYFSSKSIHSLGIYNSSILLESDGNYIVYDNNKENFINKYVWDQQYRLPKHREFINSIGTIAFLGLNINCMKLLLESEFDYYWHEIKFENYIKKNLTNLTTITMNTFF